MRDKAVKLWKLKASESNFALFLNLAPLNLKKKKKKNGEKVGSLEKTNKQKQKKNFLRRMSNVVKNVFCRAYKAKFWQEKILLENAQWASEDVIY